MTAGPLSIPSYAVATRDGLEKKLQEEYHIISFCTMTKISRERHHSCSCSSWCTRYKTEKLVTCPDKLLSWQMCVGMVGETFIMILDSFRSVWKIVLSTKTMPKQTNKQTNKFITNSVVIIRVLLLNIIIYAHMKQIIHRVCIYTSQKPLKNLE